MSVTLLTGNFWPSTTTKVREMPFSRRISTSNVAPRNSRLTLARLQWLGSCGRLSYESGLAVGGPIIQDELGYRVSVWNRQDGGWVNRVNPIPGPGYATIVSREANTNTKTVIRGALAYQVGGVLITPAMYYQSVHQDDAPRFYEAFSDAQGGIYNNGVLVPEAWTDKWTLPSIKAEAHLPFAEFTGNVSYLDRNVAETLDESAFVCPGLKTPPGSGIPGCGNPLGIGYPNSASQVAFTPTG